MCESVFIWLFEENGFFVFLCIGIEVVGSVWECYCYDVNFVFVDGCILC